MSNQVELQRKAVANWREWKKANPDAPAYVLPQMFLKQAGKETVVVRGPSLADLEQARRIEQEAEAATLEFRDSLRQAEQDAARNAKEKFYDAKP